MQPRAGTVEGNSLQLTAIFETAEFDAFREGSGSITNPGGNRATISAATFTANYGLTSRLTLIGIVPIVRKNQFTNRFGTRIADGLGDVALAASYEVVEPLVLGQPSIFVGGGLKFPTGAIEEPGGDVQRLPEAFQAGSGAYDLLLTGGYFQPLGRFRIGGATFVRIPLGSNEREYKFGNEYEVHAGAHYALSFLGKVWEMGAMIDVLYAEHDEDPAGVLPARLRDGTTVLNTGGTFVNLTPTLAFRPLSNLYLASRFSIPVVENWNGHRETSVGQVAPDLTITLSATVGFSLGGEDVTF
ncbi:MAG: hypothetical protein ABFS14_12565 [Gemmatimonadota bacterium]